MKTVFSNDMVAHVWAQRKQPYGRTGNGNYSFDGAVLLSYSTPIALFCTGVHKRDVCLISSERHSVSTARHQSLAHRAVSGVPVFTVPYLADGDNRGLRLSNHHLDKKAARKVHKKNLEYLVKEYADLCGMFKRAKSLYFTEQAELLSRLEDSANTARQYALLFALPTPKLNPSTDASTIWAHRVAREARNATPEHQAKLERARERREERKEAEAELAAWRLDVTEDDPSIKITREDVEQWLMVNSGDFQSVMDFEASIEDGDTTVDIPWASEEGEFAFSDAMSPDDE